MRRKLKVLCLFDTAGPSASQDFTEDLKTPDWKTESDVLDALGHLEHEVETAGVYDDVGFLVQRIREVSPDVVFNLTEHFRGDRRLDKGIAAVLDLMGVPYTGAGPMGLALARDKALAKKILTFHRVQVPASVTFERDGRIKVPKRMPYPVIVKPMFEDASVGIAKASLVRRDSDLRKRVRFVHESTGSDAIAEKYIQGRELFCSILGNRRLRVLPLREVRMGKRPGAPKFLTYRLKWDESYQQRWGIEFGFVTDLPEETVRRVGRICKRAYRVLDLRDYGRIDLKLAPDGRIYVLEANPNPQLAWGEDLAESAQEAGIDYEELIERIVSLALKRSAPG
jgi:D-alanine-D-alanine ligase